MKRTIKVLAVLTLTLLLGLLAYQPVYASVKDKDLPAPKGVTVPKNTTENSIFVSWDSITWPELDSDSFSSRLESTGYLVYYSTDKENWESKWVYNSKSDERQSTYIDNLENGTYYIYVCAATRRMSRINSITYWNTPGKASSVKKCTVKWVDLSNVKYTISDENVKTGKKKTIKITSNMDIKITVELLNSLAQNKEYVTVKEGRTAKITFSKTAPKGIYYFKLPGLGRDKIVSVKVYDNYPWEVATFEISRGEVTAGKKTTVKISTYMDSQLSVKPENELAQNTKNVKVKEGTTGKLVFDKNAEKGTYEFYVTVYPVPGLSFGSFVTIEVS